MRTLRSVLRLVVLTAAPLSVLGGGGGVNNLLSKADLRLWETVDDRAAPLVWLWEADADAATLVFSNRVTHIVSSVAVVRAADESHGTCAQPAPTDSAETIVDATLTQTGGGFEISCDTATLAYVSGAGGGPITVRSARSRDWKRLLVPRIYAVDSGYDIAWPEFAGLVISVQ